VLNATATMSACLNKQSGLPILIVKIVKAAGRPSIGALAITGATVAIKISVETARTRS